MTDQRQDHPWILKAWFACVTAIVGALILSSPSLAIADDQEAAEATADAAVASSQADSVLNGIVNTSTIPEARSATLKKNGEIVLNPTVAPPPNTASPPHGELTPKKAFLAKTHRQDKILRGSNDLAA